MLTELHKRSSRECTTLERYCVANARDVLVCFVLSILIGMFVRCVFAANFYDGELACIAVTRLRLACDRLTQHYVGVLYLLLESGLHD